MKIILYRVAVPSFYLKNCGDNYVGHLVHSKKEKGENAAERETTSERRRRGNNSFRGVLFSLSLSLSLSQGRDF